MGLSLSRQLSRVSLNRRDAVQGERRGAWDRRGHRRGHGRRVGRRASGRKGQDEERQLILRLVDHNNRPVIERQARLVDEHREYEHFLSLIHI